MAEMIARAQTRIFREEMFQLPAEPLAPHRAVVLRYLNLLFARDINAQAFNSYWHDTLFAKIRSMFGDHAWYVCERIAFS
jgi:hypothetical protein